ncbi:MAG: GntR family transcriptional regulator [Roseovarius sp.]
MMDDTPAISRPEGYEASGATPLYFRIFMVLEREIRGGQYPAAEPMPSEDAIAQRFGVSRVTVRHAMSLLAERGLVSRQRGKGTFASAEARAAPLAEGNFSGLHHNMAEFEQGSRVVVLEVSDAPMPGWAEVSAGRWEGHGARIIRTRGDDSGPLSYSVCHLSPQATPWIDPRRIGNRTILSALQEAGLLAARVEQRLGATVAGDDLGSHLCLEPGAPVIRMRRVVFDDWGHAFQCLELFYRADRFEYCVNLAREGDVSGAPSWVRRQP